jgi:sporulation protein YlmC with PRC-barrel domain
MKNLLSTAAVVAIFAAAPAFAADNTATPADPQPPAATDQNKTDMMKAAPAAQAPASADQNKAAAAAPAPTDQNNMASASAAVPKFITQQTDQEKLASKMIGTSIYNAANENVGKVSDLVMSDNGQIDAVVIGVGGFLGIGEKSVAVPFSAIQVNNDQNGNPKFTAQLTKDELNKAPDFLTLKDLKSKAQESAPATATGTGIGGTGRASSQ